MCGPKPTQIALTNRQRAIFEQIARRATSLHYEVVRTQIILGAVAGENNQHSANRLGLHRETARTWRERWAAVADELTLIEPDLSEAQL
jgi:hypothetical protein